MKFDGKFSGAQIKQLDLANRGETKIFWPVDLSKDVVKSFNIINIYLYHDDSEIQIKFLTKKGKVNWENGNWKTSVQVIFSPVHHEHVFHIA